MGGKFGWGGKVGDDKVYLRLGNARKEEGKQHLDRLRWVEALFVALVLVARNKVAQVGIEEVSKDAVLGVRLVRVAFCGEGAVEG